MKNEKSQDGRRTTQAEAPKLKLEGIGYNIGPDAQDRLRRLFASLLRHAGQVQVGRDGEGVLKRLFKYA